MGAGIGEVPKGPPPRLEIVEPPADSTEQSDRAARLAAEAYRNVVKALKLDSDQEDKFKQLLYDSRQSHDAAVAIARKALDQEKLDIPQRVAAESVARKKAWEDQEGRR